MTVAASARRAGRWRLGSCQCLRVRAARRVEWRPPRGEPAGGDSEAVSASESARRGALSRPRGRGAGLAELASSCDCHRAAPTRSRRLLHLGFVTYYAVGRQYDVINYDLRYLIIVLTWFYSKSIIDRTFDIVFHT